MRYSLAVLAALALLGSMGAQAQNPPQINQVNASGPGRVGAGQTVQLQGKIVSIDRPGRSVLVKGHQGREIRLHAGEEIKNFDQIRVGDLINVTYGQAMVLALNKASNHGIRERVDSASKISAKPGEKPAGMIEKQTRVIADVVAINPAAQLITLRGVKGVAELYVPDAALLTNIKVGEQLEVTFREAIMLEVLAQPAK